MHQRRRPEHRRVYEGRHAANQQRRRSTVERVDEFAPEEFG
jgi:hypothetical protein